MNAFSVNLPGPIYSRLETEALRLGMNVEDYVVKCLSARQPLSAEQRIKSIERMRSLLEKQTETLPSSTAMIREARDRGYSDD